MSTQAGTVINRVRDQIPDPVYVNNVPQPDSDGGTFRAQTLYNYLTDAIQLVAQRLNWLITDWTAMAAVANQPDYAVPSPFVQADEVLANKWRLSYINEPLTIYPSTQVTSEQPVWYGIHQRTAQLGLFVFPCPNTSDPSTTLQTAMTASSPGLITLGNTTGFLTDGYVFIDNELVRYNQLSTSSNTLGVLTRAQGGTVAASHSVNAPVQHCAVWIKGKRGPASVALSTDLIELPDVFAFHLQDYVLARVREAENEFQRAGQSMQRFEKWLDETSKDPYWVTANSIPQPEFGSPLVGGLAWGRVIVP